MNSFLKSPRPSLPLKRAPPLSPSPFPLRGQGMCQPPYSVLKPLRYKVGGPSEVYASSGAAVCGMRPHGYKSLTCCLVLARSLLDACSMLARSLLEAFSKIHQDFLSINEFFSKITPSLIKGKGGLVGFRKNPSLWQKKDGSSFGQFFAKSCSSMSCYSMLQGSSRY